MKIVIGGETFDYERKRPMSEALAIEKAWGRRYAEWEAELAAGSAEAVAVLAWVVWRRDGRDVPLEDILGGAVDFDYLEVLDSLSAAYRAAEREEAERGEGPTSGASPLTAPDGTATTSSATSAPSPRSSASGRGKSGS